MPQNTSNAIFIKGPGGYAAVNGDASGLMLTTTGGASSALNLAAGAHVVKAAPGRIVRLNVNTTATTATTVNDSATTGGVAAGNLVATVAANAVAGTMVVLDWPCANGIVVTVGTGGVVSVSFS